MEYNVIDIKNKVVKIECERDDYIYGRLDKYIKVGLRQGVNKIVIEITNNLK